MREFIASRRWRVIRESEWLEMREALPDVSESTMRECGLPIEMPWRGIAAHTLDELEEALCGMSRVYEERSDLHRYCRDEVIAAKERARWIAKSAKVEEERRRMKLEMTEWMLVWLDDPAMFPAWVRLRRRTVG